MFRIFENKSREEKLCQKYCKLMERSYKIALQDREQSVKLHKRAEKIKNELIRMDCQLIES